MASEFIKQHLKKLWSQKKFDSGFIGILAESNESGEDGEITAEKILNLIKQRYAKTKKNKT